MAKPTKVVNIQLPSDALSRVVLGQAFAEYDRILMQPGVFVRTPAFTAAEDDNRSKCFFVGRRGTGKTAIATRLAHLRRDVLEIHPELFPSVSQLLDVSQLKDTRQQPVRALVACLRRAMIDEVLKYLIQTSVVKADHFPSALRPERNYIEDFDFDARAYEFISEVFKSLQTDDQKRYLKQINRAKETCRAAQEICKDLPTVYVLIDRIDDSWDGSDAAVVLLMALMHACLELATIDPFCRPLLFVRENVFERVRTIDTEFTRLETCVVSLDWTDELLTELIERRLQHGLNTKPVVGETWDHLFDRNGEVSSRPAVFALCQKRPRDIIRLCGSAIEVAVGRRRRKVSMEDLAEARRQFSVASLKDLADEYCENYAQIGLVLSRFYGLAPEFTIPAVTQFIQKIITDEEVKRCCASWVFRHSAPHLFIELLWSIGFIGIKNEGEVVFRGFGAIATASPALSQASHVVIHPSFFDALDLQVGKVIGELSDDTALQAHGLLVDLPEALDITKYCDNLKQLKERLETCPTGRDSASEYEDIVGDVIKLCFFRTLTNVQPKSREYEGRKIRDWMASNVADSGFWEMIRTQHRAQQIVWECKNYNDLAASDFHQVNYYMNDTIGRFCVLCFRGERAEIDKYLPHVRQIADKSKGIVLLLTDQDLKVFIRQSLNGRVKEDHVRERYDFTVRAVS